MENSFYNLLILTVTIIFGTTSVHSEELYFSDERIVNGLLFPIKTLVNVGEDVVLKLHGFENQRSCLYRRTRSKVDSNVIEAFGNVEWLPVESCGIRIRNVTREDEGFWRITSQNDDDFRRGISFIEVTDNSKSFDVRDHYTPLETFSPDNTRYCTVYREDFLTSSASYRYDEFPKYAECQIPNSNLDPERNGVWNVKVGLKGFTDEVNFMVNVNSKQQKLVSDIESLSSNFAALKCNIENIRETTQITFCRFVRESDKFGVNLEPGGGNSKYGYYGGGFEKGECGLLITNPNTFDRSLWKCYLGIEVLFNYQMRNYSTIGAILNLSDNPESLVDLQSESAYGLEGKTLDILCESKTAIEYCWFTHPNGEAYSVSDTIIDVDAMTDKFWYYGNGFQLGHCGITLAMANLTDSGQWKCHVGVYKKPQLEISREIEVRVTKSNIIARNQQIEVEVGENLMIECISIPRNTPLEYCRFYLPSGVGFSIDEDIVSARPLANRYFFNPNHSLKSGYCSIIVTDVDMEHNGRWSCGAKLLGWNTESIDYINIAVVGDDLSVAGVIGISIGAACLVVLAAGYIIYRRHRRAVVTDDGTEL